MTNCASLLKCVLVAFVLLAVAESGEGEEKLASCCKTVNKREITEPVLGYLVQKASPPCVNAVIFQTESGLYCSQLNAPWVRRKIMELRKAKAQATSPSAVTSSPVSLLSIITSTASPPSSSTPLSSSIPLSSSTPLSSSLSPPSFETSGESFSGSEE